MNRRTTSHNAIQFLLSKNLNIQTVLDVGASKNTWYLQRVFPDKKHILFEPMIEFKDKTEKSYEEIDYELHTVALSDTDDPNGQMFYNRHLNDVDPDYIWCGVVPKGVSSYHGCTHPKRNIKITTLDNFLSDKKYKKPYYLKVDTDGGEMSVLRGGTKTLENVEVIQVEATCDNRIWNHISWFNDHGFELWEIVDHLYINGKMHQVDLIFVNQVLYKTISTDLKAKKERIIQDESK